jgi:hypothetical protein
LPTVWLITPILLVALVGSLSNPPIVPEELVLFKPTLSKTAPSLGIFA